MKPRYITRENFYSGIEKDENECWNMMLVPLTKDGRFASYRFEGKKVRPSLIAWKIVNGEFPKGELWNRCKNPKCVNPEHQAHIQTIFDRFINKIQLDEITGCWNWMATKDVQGYGYLKLTSKKNIRAHRFSYQHYIGEIPEGIDVLHECDNPSCCNPAHLFLGKDIDNTLDREIKERNPHKLNKHLVKEIRQKRKDGTSVTELCREYGIRSRENMYKLLNGESWRWVE